MTVESTIQRAEAEVAGGRLWRAKEILSSSLASYAYSREIFLAYANVLLESGDQLEAGKYFLLSVDEPDETQRCAIDLFLTRFRKDSWRQLLSRFPSSARISDRDDYPAVLRGHLVLLQAPQSLAQQELTNASRDGWNSLLLPTGCMLVTFGVAFCTLVGAITILNWLRGIP